MSATEAPPPPLVNVLVPFAQMSATKVPNVESERVGELHTSAAVMLFKPLMSEALAETRAFVPEIKEPIEVDAVKILESVFALTTAATDVEALKT